MKKSKQKKANKKTKKKRTEKKNLPWKKIKYGAIFVLGVIILSLVVFFVYSPLSGWTRSLAQRIPFPLVKVGESGKLITSQELIENTEAVKQFYQSQDLASKGLRVDFSTPQGKLRLKVKEKEVLNKLVENIILEEVSNKNGIYIGKKEVQEEISKKSKQAGGRKTLEINLKTLYGWSVDDFHDKVVIYQLYREKLLLKYQEESKGKESYQKILKAKDELKEVGENFAEVAKKYSEGESVENGGQLGWFSHEQMISQVADKTYQMEPGKISEVIISPLGYHIVRLDDIREIEKENGKGEKEKIKEVKISQIFIRSENFLEWFTEQKKKTPVVIWVRDYTWNAEKGEVEFKEQAMREIEQRIRLISQGDPSV